MARPIAHGGGLIAARRQYPDAPQPWIDLSTGINPIAYPIPDMPPETFTRLPEPETLAALETIAAAAYGAPDPAMVAAAPGTQSLIHLLPRLVPARRVAILGPTYAEHAAAWALAGSTVATVADLAETDGADVVVVCNPNNPDGRRFAPAALATVPGTLIVDEAFADLDGDSVVPSLATGGRSSAPTPALPTRGREKQEDRHFSSPSPLMGEGGVGVPSRTTVVLRSFGKTYGLAGIRLGFAIASPTLASHIREALGPWAVSGPALHIGARALADTAWRTAAAERLAADCARLDALLTQAGCKVLGGTRLFRLVAHDHAAGVADRLAHAGILVRRFQDRPHWLRFGLPGAEPAWQRLGTALE
jgi:cobalamin biosynthetic protein CobC